MNGSTCKTTKVDKEAAQAFLDNVQWACPESERSQLDFAFSHHRISAQKKERAEIVAWLRSRKYPYRSYYDTLDDSGPYSDGLMKGLRWAADCIEEKQHSTAEEGAGT